MTAFTRKFYQYKVYDKSGTYKTTIAENIVISDISYTQNINGGQGQQTIQLALNFDDITFIQGDIIKVEEFSDLNPSGRQIYYGWITKIDRTQDTSSQTITLICLGIATLLNSVIFQSGGSRSFNKNQDPAQTIKDVVDYFNTQYSGNLISYSGGNIDNFGSSINIDFDNDSCFDSIKEVAEATDYWWYIDAEGQVFFKAKPSTPTHLLTNQDDVEFIDRKENGETVINQVYVARSGGEVTQSDVTSQSTYGIKEKFFSQTNLKDATSAQEFADNKIAENKDPVPESSVTVNSRFDVVTIKPGDTIKILNFDFGIDNVQVLKTSYNGDNMKLTIERLFTFGDAVVGE